nr:peptide-N(4)-(N-acetyl-beta-glucosaminyl) asparagine amidase [Ipomoea batatas]
MIPPRLRRVRQWPLLRATPKVHFHGKTLFGHRHQRAAEDYIPRSLLAFLAHPRFTFVGVGVQEDADKLLRDHGLAVRNVVDLRRLAQMVYGSEEYEDPQRQEAARKTVPTDKLEEKALISLGREGNFEPTKNEQDHAFLLQLLFWFKQSFRWVNAPPCDSCGNETRNEGMGTANPSELQYGASRVEVYRYV